MNIPLLIIAIAVAVLVIFLVVVLIRVSSILGRVDHTMKLMGSDLDIIAHQADSLMAKANTLLDDVNGKVATIDPLFVAIADLSESVSRINKTSNDFATRFTKHKAQHIKTRAAVTVGRSAKKFFLRKPNKD